MPSHANAALLLLLSAPIALAQGAPQTATPPISATDAIRTIAFANSSPTGHPPTGGSWSPDGKRFTYVATDASIGHPGDIIQVDAATGKASVLATEAQLSALTSAAINEKDQDHRNRYNMSSFLWADDGRHLILDNGGHLWLYNIDDAKGTLIVDTGAGSGDDPKFSPDAKLVSYIRNHNLYVHPVADAKEGKKTGKEIALTSTTADTLLNGEVDWVYLEELEVRSNYFWSPDSSAIAYLEADEAKVPVYPITDPIPVHPTTDMQRYPQPGDPNPSVRVGIVPAKGGKPRWIEVPFSPGNDYIPRFGWVDAHTVYVEVLTRDQQHLNVYFADAHSGKSRLVYTDTDSKYLNFRYDITFVPQGRFLTTSWRDGHTHLYLYHFDEQHPLDQPAALVRQLTTGDYEVEGIERISPSADAVFYTSNEGSPLESHLWSIKLDGTGKRQLTVTPGSHDVMLSPDGIHFSDTYSTATTPPVVSLCAIGDPAPACNAFWHATPVPAAIGVTTSFVTFTAADGKTTLHGTLTLPTDKTAAASVPLILNPYGGPTAAAGIRDLWGSPHFDELLAQHGFAVLNVAGRGSGGRGRDFQQVNYKNFGSVQFADQLAALDQALARYPQFDSKRIGWWGWSWGGTFTLYAMTHTDRIRAGVAVAPVTDWRNYDSIYTERYLGLPSAADSSYIANSPITAAANLKGRILIALGTGDDNVHPANTVQFLEPLIEAGIPYDLQLFPRKTHAIAGVPARDELFNRILWQFETYLK